MLFELQDVGTPPGEAVGLVFSLWQVSLFVRRREERAEGGTDERWLPEEQDAGIR